MPRLGSDTTGCPFIYAQGYVAMPYPSPIEQRKDRQDALAFGIAAIVGALALAGMLIALFA